MSLIADEILGRMRDDEESDWPERLLDAIRDAPEPPLDGWPLSEAERLAVFCASVGLELRMAGEVLGIPSETVKSQLSRARKVLGAKNTTHAVALAIRQGLIP